MTINTKTIENLTAKQEAFALAVVEGSNNSDAYRLAYDAENMSDDTIWRRAHDVAKNGKVTARIALLRADAAERCIVTVVSVTNELERARVAALADGKYSAAVAASMGKAKINGLITDKVETTATPSHELRVWLGDA